MLNIGFYFLVRHRAKRHEPTQFLVTRFACSRVFADISATAGFDQQAQLLYSNEFCSTRCKNITLISAQHQFAPPAKSQN
jgi:hypothetical protein